MLLARKSIHRFISLPKGVCLKTVAGVPDSRVYVQLFDLAGPQHNKANSNLVFLPGTTAPISLRAPARESCGSYLLSLRSEVANARVYRPPTRTQLHARPQKDTPPGTYLPIRVH